MEYEQAITLCGGYGPYQKRLFIFLLPVGFTFVFGVSSMAYAMPAAICEFEITKYHQGLVYSAIYFGMIPSGAIWGAMSDTIGRRKTLIVTCGLTGIFELLCGFSMNYWFMFTCKFLSGCATAGVHLTYYIYISEFTDPRNKDSITMLSGAAAASGYFIQPLVAAFLIPTKIKFIIFDSWIVLNSWKIFLIISSTAPLLGLFVSAFIICETPKFLLLNDRKAESLEILKKIYVRNTGNAPETFPIKDIVLHEDEEMIEENERLAQEGRPRSCLGKILRQIKPLFQYPYLVPGLMSFAAQAITMGAFNSVRPYVPTLFSLALGFGQSADNTAVGGAERTQFCILFESQRLFKRSVKCSMEDLELDPRIFYGAAIVGLSVFISFFPGKWVVKKFGKELVFLFAHVFSALCISFFPFATSVYALLIICLYSICMQNCLTIAIGLMIGRIPTTMRGMTVSIVMVCGRMGVIIGNQVLPVITNLSCKAGFWTIAFINLLALPIVFVYHRQPNPLEENALKAADSQNTQITPKSR